MPTFVLVLTSIFVLWLFVSDIWSYVCTNNKHTISIGEPGYPLSALPRGKHVHIVNENELYQVRYHNYFLSHLHQQLFLTPYKNTVKVHGTNQNLM